MFDPRDTEKLFKMLRKEAKKWDVPVVSLIAETGRNPYRVLISCLLSLRTNDQTTAPAVKKLFAVADTPESMLKISINKIETLIYPVGFYRNKAKTLHGVSQDILQKWNGQVPDTIDALMTMKGVGRKTANLVVSQGFQKPAICVDVHVHRISNRLGWVRTQNPEETEFKLREILPLIHWKEINVLFVAFGQAHCRPQSPHCSTCKISEFCQKNGVKQSR